MDVAFALTLSAAGAFFFLDLSNYFKYRIAREDGGRLNLRLAAVAAVLLFLAAAIHALALQAGWFANVDHGVAVWLTPLLKDHAGADAQAEFIITALLSLALGPILGVLSNLFVRKERALVDAVKYDDLERLLREAAVGAKPISVTLSNGKFYVGFVMTTFDPRVDRRMITMLPLASGYRTETGTVRFTTYYDRIYEQLPDAAQPPAADATALPGAQSEQNSALVGMTLDDFRIVLPVDKALGIGLFDLKIYSLFGADESNVDAVGAGGKPAREDRIIAAEPG